MSKWAIAGAAVEAFRNVPVVVPALFFGDSSV